MYFVINSGREIEGREAMVEWFKAWINIFKRGGSKSMITL